MTARMTGIVLCGLAIIFTGCDDESVFEKRYVRIEIPEYEDEDYVSMLRDPDPDLRYLAMANLLDEGAFNADDDSKAFEHLPALLEDSSPKVRAIAAYATTQESNHRLSGLLLKLLDHRNSAVRVEALGALAQFLDREEVVTEVLKRLDDRNAIVRLTAAIMLASTAEDRRGRVASNLVERLPDRSVVEQLVYIKTMGILKQPASIDALVSLLGAEDRHLAMAAAAAMGDIGHADAVPALTARVDANRNGPAAIEALGRIPSPAAAETLLRLVDHQDTLTRRAAIKALADFPGPIAYRELARALEVSEAEYRRDSLAAVTPISDLGKAFPELVALITTVVARKLKLIEESDEVPVITEMLASDQLDTLLAGLSYIADGEPFGRHVVGKKSEPVPFWGAVKKQLSHPSLLLRQMAIKALANIIDDRTPAALSALVHDASAAVRSTAVQGVLEYAGQTGDFALLRQLYADRASFQPGSFGDDDVNFAILGSIEATVRGAERDDVTRRRRLADLRSGSETAKFLAALELSPDHADIIVPVLLAALAGGTRAQREMAIYGLEGAAQAEHADTLRAIRDTLKDRELREAIDQVVGKLNKQ